MKHHVAQPHVRPAPPFPMEPSLGQATSEESFKCWNCGLMYATNGRAEAHCPTCGETCTRERCVVSQSSNEDY